MDLTQAITHFQEHGYACLGEVFDHEAIGKLADRANALMMSETPYPGMFFQHDAPTGRYEDLRFNAGWVGPSLHYRKIEKLELDPLFLTWIENPLFERITRALLSEPISLYRSVLWNKAPGAGMAVPWHQDDGKFWGLTRAPFLQIWTALDDAPLESGCLEVLPGSHLHGLASPEGGTITPASLDDAEAESRSVALPARRGESILVHNHIWHRTGRNRTPSPRRAISLSFLDGETHCKRKRRAPRQFKRLFTRTTS